MRRLLFMIVVLFSIYMLFQIGIKYFGKGHEINYNLNIDNNNYDIYEKFITNTKNERDNYFLSININDQEFVFQTSRNFNKTEMIVKNIKYYHDDNYSCLLPIFKNNVILFDFLCINNNKITFYHNIKGQNTNLDQFVNNIDVKNYNPLKWEDNKKEEVVETPVTLYSNNMIKNHYIGVTNYKGIYTISNDNLKKIHNINIFNKDVYERKLSAVVKNYYITADYNSKYDFNSFTTVNLINNKTRHIVSNDTRISFDSYIQGIVDNSLYIFDKTNKKQYEVNIKTFNFFEIGNSTLGVKIYKNNKWETVDILEAVKKELVFSNTDNNENTDGFTRIAKAGNELSGYYYYYVKNGNKYDVYKSSIVKKDKVC